MLFDDLMWFNSAEKLGLKAEDGKGCPRCNYCVYAAEQMISKNRVIWISFHLLLPALRFYLKSESLFRSGIVAASTA